MVQRLRDRDAFKILLGSVQEWATAGSEPDFADFVDLSAAHALMHRVVLAIDRKQRLVVLARFGSDQLSSCDQTFLIGKPDALTGFHRFVGSLESRNADDGADNKIYFRMSSDFDRACSPLGDLDLFQSRSFQFLAKLLGAFSRRHGDDLRLPSLRVFKGKVEIISSGKRDHAEALGIG